MSFATVLSVRIEVIGLSPVLLVVAEAVVGFRREFWHSLILAGQNFDGRLGLVDYSQAPICHPLTQQSKVQQQGKVGGLAVLDC